ncbi:dUTP diphosphatase [Bacteroides sp.]|uniref:dUTP diphosphatase n=1 Tax=Bacteroides sp. TaxID=29523 RepID=UPI0026223269|nr:dUTP diphosphatase [Bacteroides sp.]MDD3040542.1 dUTP diphosphatase [Bacteroides sp.]
MTKTRTSDAGTDIKADESCVIMPGGHAAIDTGVIIIGEPGKYCRLAERSGLALKNGIKLGGGIIDEEYRGTVKVIMFNFGSEPFAVHAGDRIAQVIIEEFDTALFTEVATDEILLSTSRGDRGFGSSGK